jgi:hypothetical protein
MRLGVADGNRTRDLLHCRRTLYAKSHLNGVIDCHSGIEPGTSCQWWANLDQASKHLEVFRFRDLSPTPIP